MQIRAINSGQIQAERQIQAPSPIKGAQPGDLINATVTSTEGGRVTLALSDGSAINAGKLANEALLPGDTVTLEVSSMSEHGTSLRLVEINGQELRANVSELEFSLMRMNVTPDSARVEYAKVLRDFGLTLSPQTLARMGDILRAFPDTPLAQAALFAASEMPITQENVSAFRAFAEKPAHAAEFSSALEKLISENPAISKIPVGQDAPVNIDGKAFVPDGLSPQAERFVQNSNEWQAMLKEAPKLTDAQARDAVLNLLTSLPNDTSAADKQILLKAFSDAGGAVGRGAHGAPPQGVPGEPPQNIPGAPRDNIPGEPLNQSMNTPDAQQKNIPDAPQSGIPGAPPQSAPDAQQSLPRSHRAEPFDKILNGMFAVLEKEGVDSPDKLKDASGRLMNRVSSLVGALEEYGGHNTKATAQTGQAIVTQLKMGGELHNLMYAQIPFEISPGEKSSAELYVLKRDKSRKTIDDANATVALCLETQNMGRFETLLRVERNELSIQFRVENENIGDYVKSRLSDVRKLDFPAQYHVRHAGVTLQNEAVTPVNAAKTMASAFNINNTGMLDLTV